MKPDFIARLAFSSLAHSKLRTWLTVTGIVIGVAAVVMIIAIGNGLQANVQQQLSGFGADLVQITPGFERAAGGFAFRGGGGQAQTASANITVKDLQAVKIVKNVKEVTGVINGRTEVVFYSQTVTAQVKGVDPLVWGDFSSDQLDSGRMLTVSDSNSVVIGGRIASQYFNRPVTVNSLLTINGKGFKVVGILAQGGSFGGNDNVILMPIAQARTVLTGFEPDQFSSLSLKVADVSTLDQTVLDIEQALLELAKNAYDARQTIMNDRPRSLLPGYMPPTRR